MCCIIKVKPRVTLPKDLLMTIYENNPDGYGMMVAEKEGLIFHKDVKDFDDFWKYWRDMNRDAPRAIHFRRKTHGLINKDNCHPFFPNGSVGFMHNGVIQVEEVHKDMNDTYNFMMLKMKPFIDKYPDIVEDKNFYKLIEEITGTSRLLFLTANGVFHMTNEKMWHNQYGCMFSNGGALRKTEAYTSKNYSYPSHGYNQHGANTYDSLRDDTTDANDNTPRTLNEIQEALRDTDIDNPTGPWADDHYNLGVHRFGTGSVNRGGEVCTVPPLLRIYDDRLPYGREVAQEDMETLFAEANRILEEQGIIDEEDDSEIEYCTDMQSTHTGTQYPRSEDMLKLAAPVVAEGTFEKTGSELVKGLPEVDDLPVGDVTMDAGDGNEDDMEVYLTPSEFANMTEQEIVDWADENPHGAATAILILTGRV